MNRSMWSALGVAASMGLASMLLAADDQARATFGIDAVELVRGGGRETPGDPAFAVAHGGFVYHFASAESKAAFEADPTKYEIQYGGACARMGPLSGTCRTDLPAVHEGKVYLFASPQCRETFLKNPSALLEREDARPEGTPAQADEAAALLARAARAVGGDESLNALQSIEWYRERDEEAGKVTYRVVESKRWSFPASLRTFESWNESAWAQSLEPQKAYFADSTGRRDMVEIQKQAMNRLRLTDPIAMLRAREHADFVAFDAGPGEIEGSTPEARHAVRWVTCHTQGVTVLLGIEPETGVIRAIEYQGRGPSMTIGTTRKVFDEFEEFGGVRLPRLTAVWHEGKPLKGSPFRATAIRVNQPLDAAVADPRVKPKNAPGPG